MPYVNRTITDSGVQLDGNLFSPGIITGTGVTPAQAIALAAPLVAWLESIPYTLDERGVLSYRSGSVALTHAPELLYAPGHPKAGQPIFADYLDGDIITRYSGAPMPFLDFDTIDPHALKNLLNVLRSVRDAILNAT